MKCYEFECVIYNGDVVCCDCLHNMGIDEESEEVMPIFADCETSGPVFCVECGEYFDYMNIIEE